MPSLYPVKVNFSNGEISPLLYARADTVAHEAGLQLCENFIPTVKTLTRRAGFISAGSAKISAGNIRLIPWIFSEAAGQQYVLEIGYHTTDGGYIRVWRVDTHVYGNVQMANADAGSPIQWASGDIRNIRKVQKNDVMYFFDGEHNPLKLIRSGDEQPGTWTINETSFVGSPFALSNKLTYKLFEYTKDYFDAVFSKGYTKSGLDHFFLENPVVTSGSIEMRSGIHDSDLDIGPIAFGDSTQQINPSKPSYLNVVEKFALMIEGYIDIPVNGYYTFGMAVNNHGDVNVDGRDAVSYFSDSGLNISDNATMFAYGTRTTLQLTSGANYFRARMLQEWNEEDFGLYVGYRKEPAANGIEFTGDGDNNLTIVSRTHQGRNIFEINAYIVSAASGTWQWRWRVNALGEDIEANYGNWTMSAVVPLPVTNYALDTGIFNPFATISIPNTGHVNGDSWTFKVGFNIIPYTMFERTQFVQENSYPRVGCFYQERLLVGGFPEKPNSVKCSKIGDPENFISGTKADDAFEFSIASLQNDSLYWMLPVQSLLIGTAAAEYSIGNGEDPITPQYHPPKPHTHNGSKFVEPIVTETGTVLYVEKSGKRLREFAYSEEGGKYSPRDISILADHLVSDGIKELSYMQGGRVSRYSDVVNVCWALTETGDLRSLTYEPEHKSYAWARHKFQDATGKFKAICCVPGSGGGDELWAVIDDSGIWRVAYLKYDNNVDMVVDFTSKMIPNPFIIETRGGMNWTAFKSWVRMRIMLYNTQLGNSGELKISRDIATAYNAMELIDSHASEAANAAFAIDQYLPGSDETGQFVLATQDYCNILGIAGMMEVNEG